MINLFTGSRVLDEDDGRVIAGPALRLCRFSGDFARVRADVLIAEVEPGAAREGDIDGDAGNARIIECLADACSDPFDRVVHDDEIGLVLHHQLRIAQRGFAIEVVVVELDLDPGRVRGLLNTFLHPDEQRP